MFMNLKSKILNYYIYARTALSDRYNIFPYVNLKFNEEDNKSDDDAPACCSYNPNELVRKYTLQFNLALMEKLYSDYVKLMTVHEVCHIYQGEMEPNDPEDRTGGHDKLFLDLMENFRNVLSEKEWEFHKIRHVSKYLRNGKLQY